MTALDVYLHGDRVGRLERLQHAALSFAYESSWVERGGAPLSLGLPVRDESFADPECRPFFSGLLPEGQFLKAVASALHVSATNPFSVLQEIAGECAGAVSLVALGAPPPTDESPSPRWLEEADLERIISELPTRPLLIGADPDDEVLRLSLAGAQNKLPLLAESGRLGITRGRPPSTHILMKPDLELSGLVANEAYCLALARSAGLDAVEAEPISVGDQEGLLVRRYDRIADRDGGARRVHQEDLCQALGFLPEQKYEGEGGPGVAACTALLRSRTAVPARAVPSFLDALIFNLLIGNADAHSKNYSLLLEGDGAPRLAPLYDLLCVSVYGGRYGRKMAMKYGGEYRPGYIRGRHLDRMAGDLELAPRTARSRAVDLAERVVEALSVARSELPDRWQGEHPIDRIEDLVRESAERLRAAAAESG